jgi:hypothetical protein
MRVFKRAAITGAPAGLVIGPVAGTTSAPAASPQTRAPQWTHQMRLTGGNTPVTTAPGIAAALPGHGIVVGVPACDGGCDFCSQEPGQRDGAGLVRFRGAHDDTAANVGVGAADIDAAAVKVDVADAQGGSLAPAQTGVGQQQDEGTPAARLGGEREDLGVGEVDVIAALRPGKTTAPIGRTGKMRRTTVWTGGLHTCYHISATWRHL